MDKEELRLRDDLNWWKGRLYAEKENLAINKDDAKVIKENINGLESRVRESARELCKYRKKR